MIEFKLRDKEFYIVALLIAIGAAACTNADISQLTSLGSDAEITCYSGGKEFYHGFSSGKIHTEQGSDGWYFREKASGKLIRISGSCVVRN